MFVLSGGSNFQATKDQWNSGFDNCTSNQVDFTDSTSNNIYLTGVSLEVGDTATPFEHRSISDELARCQRYYWKDTGITVQAIAQATVYDGFAQVFFPVPMRATPTGTSLTGGSTFARNISGSPSVGINTGTVNNIWSTHIEYLTQANGATAIGIIGYGNGTATASAEL